MAGAKGGGGGIQVSGCQDERVGATIRGIFASHGENHGKPVYRKGTQDVFLYYWDERDGDDFCGWWFGPKVGGDNVWAYQPMRSPTPPAAGWQAPYGSAVDTTLMLKAIGAASVTPVATGAAASAPNQRLAPAAPAASAASPSARRAAAAAPARAAAATAAAAAPAAAPAAAAAAARSSGAAARTPAVSSPAARAAAQPALPTINATSLTSSAQDRSMTRQAAGEAADSHPVKRSRQEMERNREILLAKKKREEESQQQLAALSATRTAIQKIRAATPENFDQLKKEVDSILAEELTKCGPEAANILFEEAEKHVEFARERVANAKEQRRKMEERKEELEKMRAAAAADAADPTAPPWLDVPVASVGQIIGKGGSTLRRVIAETNCQIEVADRSAASHSGMLPVQLIGKAPERRKAKEAIELLMDGGSVDDVSLYLQGGIVVLHKLAHPGREEWLKWKLKAVEYDTGFKVNFTATSLQIRSKDQKQKQQVKKDSEEWQALHELLDKVTQDAQGLVELTVDAKKEFEPTEENIKKTIDILVDQHHVLVKLLQPEEEVVPILVLGPADGANDAAALLWARYVQGKAVGPVLRLATEHQVMEKIMAQDFDKDLRALEEDQEVEVGEGANMLWVSGPIDRQEAVAEATTTVEEMLQFYQPEDYLLLSGLEVAGLQKLKQDPELQVIAEDPLCAIYLNLAKRSAWICGPRGKPPAAAARRRVEALARVGGVSEEAKKAEASAIAAAK